MANVNNATGSGQEVTTGLNKVFLRELLRCAKIGQVGGMGNDSANSFESYLIDAYTDRISSKLKVISNG